METYIWGKLNTSTILKAGKIIGGEHAKDRAKEALRRIALAIEDPKSGSIKKIVRAAAKEAIPHTKVFLVIHSLTPAMGGLNDEASGIVARWLATRLFPKTSEERKLRVSMLAKLLQTEPIFE